MTRLALAGAALIDGTGAPPAPGRAADLRAVAGDPAERLEAPDEVRLPLAGGRAVVPRPGVG